MEKTDQELIELSQQLAIQQEEFRAQRAAIAEELRRRALARVVAAAGLSMDALVRGQNLVVKASV